MFAKDTRFDVITIFPNLFSGFLTESLISRAQKRGLLKINIHNLRKWTTDRHQTVDGKPYGGGPGLVFKIEPIYKAVKTISVQRPASSVQGNKKTKVILFSPRGKKFDQKSAKGLAKYDQLIFICGRYEGVDERVTKHIADEVISIGDYVLSGGEVPTMVVIEAVSRLIPGVVGKQESVEKFDHPQYTRPESFIPQKRRMKSETEKKRRKEKKWRVPKVLLSGDHEKVTEWRKKLSKV